jgi:predicted small lipoprotein YifL
MSAFGSSRGWWIVLPQGHRTWEELASGPSVSWLRMVYNCRDDTRLGGRALIGIGPDVHTGKTGILGLLLLAALVVTLSACGAGSGGSSPSSEKQQAPETAGSSEQETGGAGSPGRASGRRLEHPALGSAEAPVVLTEYSDYQ